jgi:hypothetical protein|tara:strand:- start:3959 stop:5110 length:1152 start_codon:yes stop_codon:yes gene_type:complete
MLIKAQEVTAPRFGKGLLNISGKDNTWSMNFAARVQYLTTTTWMEKNQGYSSPESNSLIRRSRLKFKGFAYHPNLTYKLELGFSNRDISGGSNYTSNSPRIIIDASVRWKFNKNLWIQFGQAKLPGNIERIISSSKLALVDRSILNSKFNIDRDFGLQMRYKFNLSKKFVVKETFAISQGEGRNVSKGNLGGHKYTARIDLLPFGNFKSDGDYSGDDIEREKKPKLLVGVAYDYNNNSVKTRGNTGNYMETTTGFFKTDIKTLFVNSHFKYMGLSFMGEYANRSSDDAISKNSDGSLTGDIVSDGSAINFQIGYVTPSNVAITTRFTNIKFKDIIYNDTEQLTIGLSKYFVKHKLKIQSDLTSEKSINDKNKIFYRLQFEIHF